MAKPWSEVANSEGYKALAPDKQEAARNQYFDQVVAPRAPQDKLAAVRSQFDAATKMPAPQSLDQEVADSRAKAMQEGQLSADGSRVVRPDGTTIPVNPENSQGVLASQQEPVKKLVLPQRAEPRIPIPTNWQVAKNAVAKGVAAVPDMVGNVIPNAVNLVSAAGGAGLYEAGLIDSPPDLPLENPDMARRIGEATGVINPEYNPQTQGQRYLDTGVQAATGALLTGGAGGIRQAITNTAGGVAGGEVAQLGAETGHPVLGLLGGLATGGAVVGARNKSTGTTIDTAAQEANAIKDAGFAAARESGIKIPISQSNPNSLFANTVDVAMGGRPRMQQTAAIANQSKATQAAAKDLGLEAGKPISIDNLKTVRDQAYKTGYEPLENAGVVKVSPKFNDALDALQADSLKAKKGFAGYDDGGLTKAIDSLRTQEFDSSSGVAMVRQLREDAGKAYAGGDKKMGKALKGAAGAIEDEMENHLKTTGQEKLLDNYKNARQQIAKTMTVEKALNSSTGEVSAQSLGRMLDKGVPLSGDLRKIAEASKLPGASLADTKYATTGASQLEGLASLGGAIGTGNPLILAAPIVRGIGRKVALGDSFGKKFGAPNYSKWGLTGGDKNHLMINSGLNAERQNEQ